MKKTFVGATGRRDDVRLYREVVLLFHRKNFGIASVALTVLLGNAVQGMAQPDTKWNADLGVPTDSLPGCIHACDSVDCLHQCVATYSSEDGIAKFTTRYVDPIQSARTADACFAQALDREQLCQEMFLPGAPGQRDPADFGICIKGVALGLLSCEEMFDQSDRAAPVPVETSRLAMVELTIFFDLAEDDYPGSLNFDADPQQQLSLRTPAVTPFQNCVLALKERGEFCLDTFVGSNSLLKICLHGVQRAFDHCLDKAGLAGPVLPPKNSGPGGGSNGDSGGKP